MERWIPESHRRTFIERNLSVAQMNTEERDTLRVHREQKARRHQLSELETNFAAEKFGIAKKKRCGLCLLEYSDVNLVLTVPSKAVIDLRTTWIENFGVKTSDDEKLADKLNVHEAFTYDDTRLCVLCAQFFQGNDFETYRPSYEKKRGEARARRQAIEDAAQRAYWDPLTTVEAERNAEMEQTLSPEKQPTCPPAT